MIYIEVLRTCKIITIGTAMSRRVLFLLATLLLCWVCNAHVTDENVPIWPMPARVRYGNEYMVFLTNDFKVDVARGFNGSKVLQGGISRFLQRIHNHDNVELKLQMNVEKRISNTPPAQAHPLNSLLVIVASPNDDLHFGIDESYDLYVPHPKHLSYGLLRAKTVYGALHGLETLSQLCQIKFSPRKVMIPMAPWAISDEPRFFYRGLLIDTARHFQPLTLIKKVIEGMSYSKLNVLHWHIVDTQSFPLEIPSLPKLWRGSYSSFERYTMNDAREIVEFAKMRGIHVVPEIDVPGHSKSWGYGYPKLWPSPTCQEPLDVSNEFTFEVIKKVVSDLSKVFHFKFIHLGGDEVNTSCWSETAHIRDWMALKNFSESEAYKYFVLRAQKIALSHGFDPVNWEETFTNFGAELNPKTVVHNWLVTGVAENVVRSGLRCIVSNQDKWYLDHLDATWEDFYTNEPLVNIRDPQQQKLVIGGEVCMWGETVDASDIEQTIWPRAAAAAERLWSPYDNISKDPSKVINRLSNFRCLLNRRGIAAAPLFEGGRGTPIGPGSCYSQ